MWRLVHPDLHFDPLAAHPNVHVLMWWHGVVVVRDGAPVAASYLGATVCAFLNAAAAWVVLPPDARLAFLIDAGSPPCWPWEAMWGRLVIASALAHVGCPPAPEHAGPWSALAPQRLRATTPRLFSAMPVWFGVLKPPSVGGGASESAGLLNPATGVMSGPRFVLVGIYIEELGRALRALTCGEW